MLTMKSLLNVLEHEQPYGGPRRHFFGQSSAPRHARKPEPAKRWQWNEKGEVLCYSLKRRQYEWVLPMKLFHEPKRERRPRKPA